MVGLSEGMVILMCGGYEDKNRTSRLLNTGNIIITDDTCTHRH
jgi:hypothetical protein